MHTMKLPPQTYARVVIACLTVLFCTSATPRLEAQTLPDLAWVVQAGGTDSITNNHHLAVDSIGNTYVTGEYEGSFTFGIGEPEETTLSGEGSFVARYDNAGALVWVKRIAVDASSYGIAVDSAGNVSVAGTFRQSTTFGEGGATATTLTSAGNVDIFVARYDNAGALLWAKQAGGAGYDQASGVAIDASGNSYITGYFRDSATFGAGDATATTLTSTGGPEIYLARYDSAGTLVWAKQAGGTASDRGEAIAVDAGGNSYLTGTFNDSAVFGAGEPTVTTLLDDGDGDMFLARYDSTGALVWAKRAGGTAPDSGKAIAVDAGGNSYLTGAFSASAVFGLGEPAMTTLTSSGEEDVFLARYDSSGTLLWAKQAGGASWDSGRDIHIDASGNSYVSGEFEDSAIFGPGESGQTTLVGVFGSGGNNGAFVAKYDSAGTLVWAKQPAGYTQASASDATGNVFVSGNFSGTVTFGADGSNPTTITSLGIGDDLFLLKYAGGPEISFDSLASLVDQFVTRPLVKRVLLAEVEFARQLSERGNTFMMNYILRVFVRGVSRLSGTVLTADQAATLTEVATGLMQ